MRANVWEQVDRYARAETDKRLRAIGWRLDSSSTRDSWTAYRIESGDWNEVSAQDPDALLERASEREKECRAHEEAEAAWAETEMAS